MPRIRVIGRGVTTILVVCCLLALLVGTLAGCQDQSSPLPLPPPDEAPTETPLPPATPTIGLSADEARDAAAEWLRANAIPFETTEPGSGFEDLMPLKEIIGDARIVALGEATHGTHEFFQMKHRLVEFLVEEMGFNLFAIEANWPEANLVNDYVHTGEGDPAALLAGLGFWTWNTQEVLDMIRWMCAHNQDPGDAPEISFVGFDMQNPDMAMDNVIGYFQEVEPSYAFTATLRYACIDEANMYTYAGLSGEEQATCREELQEVLDHLVAGQETYEALSSPQEFAFAVQSTRIVLQAEDCLADEEYTGDRDRYMAENIVWLPEQAGPDARIIIWAHNGHVANRVGSNGEKSMGVYLREVYGEGMVIFGFAFYQGRFNALGHNSETGQFGRLRSHKAPPAPQDSYEWYFRAAEMPRMILDLRGVSGASLATGWLAKPRKFRSIGAAYDDDTPEDYFYDADITTRFDAIIYFEETTPSVLLSF